MNIEKIHLNQLRNEEHMQFHQEVDLLLHNVDPVELDIKAEASRYTKIIEKEYTALQVIRKSASTEHIAEADNKRDDLFQGLHTWVKGAVNHYDQEVRDAAYRFMILLDQYGNVKRKTYEAETAAIKKLVDEANSTYKNESTIIGISKWVEELKNANNAFDILMQKRYSLDSKKTELKMKDVRIEVDNVYSALTSRINALIIVNGPKNYKSLVKEINIRIEHYNNLLAQRKGRSKKTINNTDDDGGGDVTM